MNILSFNNEFSSNIHSNKDLLSGFKQYHEKTMTIHQGMSVKEISDVVSEKIISIVKDQFQATKEQSQVEEMK